MSGSACSHASDGRKRRENTTSSCRPRALSASTVCRWTREMPFPSAATDVASTPSLATGERFPAGDDGAGKEALREQPQCAPRRAHPAQEIPPRQPELERVVEVLAGG